MKTKQEKSIIPSSACNPITEVYLSSSMLWHTNQQEQFYLNLIWMHSVYAVLEVGVNGELGKAA